jgi:hypothetical protein
MDLDPPLGEEAERATGLGAFLDSEDLDVHGIGNWQLATGNWEMELPNTGV